MTGASCTCVSAGVTCELALVRRSMRPYATNERQFSNGNSVTGWTVSCRTKSYGLRRRESSIGLNKCCHPNHPRTWAPTEPTRGTFGTLGTLGTVGTLGTLG